MDLILVRHADTGNPLDDAREDLQRPLSKRGMRQASCLAQWLEDHAPADAKVFCSPSVRTRQTAQALQTKTTVAPSLAPNASIAHYLETAHWPDAKHPVILIGHQPVLGQVASFLLAGQELPWTFKKGSIWWISRRQREHEFQNVLRAVVNPEHLGA